MREFSATDLGNKTGDVLAAASQEPIAIARHGKARFVMLSTEAFERLRRPTDPRIARRTVDIPTDEGAELVAELERLVQDDD